jgi:hypothetical protein
LVLECKALIDLLLFLLLICRLNWFHKFISLMFWFWVLEIESYCYPAYSNSLCSCLLTEWYLMCCSLSTLRFHSQLVKEYSSFPSLFK